MAKKVKQTRLQKLKPVFKAIVIAFIGIYLSFFVYNFTKNNKNEDKIKTKEVKEVQKIQEPQTLVEQSKRPKYWFYMARQYMWIFFSVDNVLKRLGLEKIDMEIKHGEFVHMDWNLLWSYDYHNEIPIDFKKVQYHQRINHIPGNFVLTMKDFFALNTISKYVPRAFNDTEKLREYAAANPGKRFVQKLWSNRGISLKSVDEMNFKIFGPGYKYFGQEYIEDPLLIDGYKFDFGVYVLVSSFDPLRIYYYEKNVLIRLCAEKYNPNDYSNVNSYVISDACNFPWDIEGIAQYYNKSYTYKESLNAYLTKHGYDVSKIWTQVEDCVREIVVEKEESFKFWMHRYAFKHTFFELFRFDFILNNNLDLFLIEINQSPNVNPSAILWRDQRLFENLLFNVFTLIGVGSYLPKEDFRFGNDKVEAMICHDETLTVLPEICINSPCNDTCSDKNLCSLCFNCMTNNQKHELHLAYRETKNKGTMKRVFPAPAADIEEMDDEYLNNLNEENRWLTLWYIEMCKKDVDFC
ncbi:hypothetical protein PVAND_016533 [Polypedilum vanderplanki]|uniref:Uncharacterized protein n=1 Tax=Polypedilum vanderplanki TaxID=319348 RepID=A0A9J6BFP7_POLVA|nr:hypothetical protein PVAND_016533 [Polypedilum vanderplanki]